MRALSVLFLCSGAAGLVYETAWGRSLHLVFGTSQFAIATVLAAFMAGLALGGAVGAVAAPRIRRPLRVYAVLEIGIAVFAAAFPWLLALVEPLYLAAWRALEPTPVEFGVVQFALVGTLLLVPTACMGATLPILLGLPLGEVTANPDDRGAPPPGRGAWTGKLYALNTAGAVLGTIAATAWFLPLLGVRATTLLFACVNVGCALGALWLDRGMPEVPPPPPADSTDLTPRWVLAVAALAGFSSLALEVAWFRLMTLVLGGSVYAFAVMLVAFLVGIAGGGALGGPDADRLHARGRVVQGIVAAQLGVALLSWIATFGYWLLPVLFVKGFFVIAPMPELLWPMKCALAMVVMVPPALFMGATFPLLVRAAGGGALGAAAGRVYAANTVGSVLGSFLSGFVLLPSIRVVGTLTVCIGANLLAAVVAAWRIGGARTRVGVVLAAAAAQGVVLLVPPPWDPMWMTSGVYKYVDNLDEATSGEMERRFIARYEMLYYEEGLSSVVTVARNRVTGNVWLANNGKIDASSTTDMPTQVLVAHLPFLFTGDRARDAMVIGLASGITLGAATLHRELERVEVVEIEPATARASEFFVAYNHRPLLDPRVTLRANDGRNQVLLAAPGSYDVIINEPSNPWLTGVSNLFTREFFEVGKSRLRPGGVWAQWVQMYGMDQRDLRAVMKTFAGVFSHVLYFSTIQDADIVMIGSDSPLTLSDAAAARMVRSNNAIEAELQQIGVFTAEDLLAHFLFDRQTALAISEDVPENTDDNLLVEFSAPGNLHRETSQENFDMLRPRAVVPSDAVASADGMIRLAQAYGRREEWVRALLALKEAEAREPGRADVGELYRRYQEEIEGG